jgi:hypothetical protein
VLFTNAKAGENNAQQIVGVELACNFIQSRLRQAQLFSQQVQ